MADFNPHNDIADNSTAPVYLSLTNLAVLGDAPNADIRTNRIGDAFVPKSQESFIYDDDGNLLSDGRWTNTWNGESRLIVQITTDAAVAAGAPKQKLEYGYDSQGRRFQKVLSEWNGTSWDGQYTNRFVYDDWNLIAIGDPADNFEQSFIWGLDLSGTEQGVGGVGGLLAMNAGADGVHLYSHDGNGNVASLIDTATESLSAEYEYSPFGGLLRSEGVMAAINPFRFSTKYCDSETWLYPFGYRYYSNEAGRWLNRDPISEFGGSNVYMANENNMISNVDPQGLQSLTLLNSLQNMRRRVDPYDVSNGIGLPQYIDAQIGLLNQISVISHNSGPPGVAANWVKDNNTINLFPGARPLSYLHEMTHVYNGIIHNFTGDPDNQAEDRKDEGMAYLMENIYQTMVTVNGFERTIDRGRRGQTLDCDRLEAFFKVQWPNFWTGGAAGIGGRAMPAQWGGGNVNYGNADPFSFTYFDFRNVERHLNVHFKCTTIANILNDKIWQKPCCFWLGCDPNPSHVSEIAAGAIIHPQIK